MRIDRDQNGFTLIEPAKDGFRPVLTVCAGADLQGKQGVSVARRAYDDLKGAGGVEGGAVLTDTMVSFALALTPAGEPLCRSAKSIVSSACGAPVQAQAQAQAPAQPAQPQAQPVQPPAQAQDQDKADDCKDEYGPTCAQDFGDMCTEDYVREMCKKYCGVCGGSAQTQAAAGTVAAAQPAQPVQPAQPAQPAQVPPATDPMRKGSTPEAPQVPQNLGKPDLAVVSPGQTVPLDVDAVLQNLQAVSPDGSPIRVADIRFTYAGFQQPPDWQPAISAFQDSDGRWHLRASALQNPGHANPFRSGTSYNADLVLDNGQGQIRVGVSFSEK